MKDEHGGKSIVTFVGVKSKIYLILDESNNKTKRAHTKVTMPLKSFKNFTIHYLRKRFLDTQSEE